MIHDHDRSGWIGASDTSKVMGRWDTETFRKWWSVKLGIRQETFTVGASWRHYAGRHVQTVTLSHNYLNLSLIHI